MTKTKTLDDVRKNISPRVLRAAERKTREMIAAMPLQELRTARKLSQEQLAEILHVQQASISKLERRTDMYISSLRNFVRAMGGELEINVVFPDGIVSIDQFQKIEDKHKLSDSI
ncbi:MAG: XRE family transcriptional regulator [Candidatus Berkiellales bacterium]